MTKVKIDPNGFNDTSTFLYGGTRFSFVSAPKKGRKQCIHFCSCRDYLHEYVRATLHKDNDNCVLAGYDPHKAAPIDLHKLRMLVSCGAMKTDQQAKSTKEKLFAGKRIINAYERMAGWSESKITSVDYKIPASDVDTKNLYLITGPANWMKSPHLISMVTLIIRVSMRTSKPIQFKTMKDLQNVWKSFAAMEIQDSELIKSSYKFFPLLMKYNKKIFKETASEAYPADAVSFHSPGGIVSLCNNNGPLAAVSDRVAELKRQYAK